MTSPPSHEPDRSVANDSEDSSRPDTADGGVVAGIQPWSVESLDRFLREAGGRGFNHVETTDDEVVVRRLRRLRESPAGNRPSIYRGTRLDLGVGDAFHAHIDDIRDVTVVRAASRVDLVPGLATAITTQDEPVAAIAAMADIAADRPGDITPYLDDVIPLLSVDDEQVRDAAARGVSNVASTDPDGVVDAVPELTALLEARAAVAYATYALSQVAEEHPSAVKPAAPALSALLDDTSVSDTARLSATAALGRVVSEFPAILADSVAAVAALLDSENPKLRNNAVGLLGDIAQVHTDLVHPYVDRIAALFPTEDDYIRVNATCALARVADDFPNPVAAYTALFIRLLGDDHELVRENACWALGHLATPDAAPALADTRHDPDPDVSVRAQWALAQIDASR